MQFNVSADIREVTRRLDSVSKLQIPFAASKSINELVFEIARKEMPVRADQEFEGGATAFTKRGFAYQKSNKRNLTGYIYLRDVQNEYLKYVIQGGTRLPNKRAILSTTKHSKRNKYGNLTRATRQKMFADKSKYFSGVPKGMANTDANRGVWERYGRQSGRRVRMVAQFKKSQQYRPTFPFAKHAERVVVSRNYGFTPRFKRNLAMAIRTAR